MMVGKFRCATMIGFQLKRFARGVLICIPFLVVMALPPKTPMERATELRLAFNAMERDPVFLAEWEKSQGMRPRLVQGDEAVNIAATILKAPKEAVEILKKLANP